MYHHIDRFSQERGLLQQYREAKQNVRSGLDGKRAYTKEEVRYDDDPTPVEQQRIVGTEIERPTAPPDFPGIMAYPPELGRYTTGPALTACQTLPRQEGSPRSTPVYPIPMTIEDAGYPVDTIQLTGRAHMASEQVLHFPEYGVKD